MAKNITSVSDIKVGDTIKSKINSDLYGIVTAIDSNHIKYKSINTGLEHIVHLYNITKYEII